MLYIGITFGAFVAWAVGNIPMGYRVRDKLFKIVPVPQYDFGEIVKIQKRRYAIAMMQKAIAML